MLFSTIMKFRLLIIIICFNEHAAQLPTSHQRFDKFLQDLGVRRTTFAFNKANNGRLLVTNLDDLRGLLVMSRHLLLSLMGNEVNEIYRNNQEHGKIQPIIPDYIPFPCNLTNARSSVPPTSVHRVRPGDIDVVAAFGDSLSAGNGILSTSIPHIGNEFRGLVFSGGGHGNWHNTLTLPNILKVLNPNLYGYTTEDSLVVDSSSHLNIAEPMLMSRDLPYQAKVLVSRLHRDPRIDMQHHWKFLTIFVGANDFCSDMCHHDNLDNFVSRHESDMRRTLTILRDQIPRLLVNILPSPNMVLTLYKMRGLPFQCRLVHSVGCHCVISQRYNATYMKRISEYIQRWQKVDQLLAKSPEFQTDNFTVIYHPFSASPPIRKLSNGNTDLRFFAADCFHFSQLGQAGLANTLWNSMLQPIGQKQTFLSQAFEHFECPNEKRPFIATIGNS